MIADVLLQNPWLVPVALVALVIVGPFAGAWLAARPRIAVIAALLSLLPLAALTLVPVERELYGVCEVRWTLPTPGRVEAFANLALFVAPVLLAAVATRRLLRVFTAAVLLSAGIEVLQAAVPALGRSCDTDDFLANTLGAALGTVLAVLALALARRRARRADRPGSDADDVPEDEPLRGAGAR
ncbi:MAG TPA: VanZ family protein [Naasia sp.]